MTRRIFSIDIRYTDMPDGKFEVVELLYVTGETTSEFSIGNTVSVTDDINEAVQQGEILAALYNVPLRNFVDRPYRWNS